MLTPNKTDITSREDIKTLVITFYTKVREDKDLGPFFNTTISDWEQHFEHLTTFWESSLFIARKLPEKYKGNPLQAHIDVDAKFNHTINEKHFGVWLNLWYETLEELFEGEVTENAKRRARKMGTFIYLNLFQARPKIDKSKE